MVVRFCLVLICFVLTFVLYRISPSLLECFKSFPLFKIYNDIYKEIDGIQMMYYCQLFMTYGLLKEEIIAST